MHAELCPVCSGSGKVVKKLHSDSSAWVGNEVECHGCKGAGWIAVPDDPPTKVEWLRGPRGDRGLMPDKYEELARKYIEGSGGLLDLYYHELAVPLCAPPEVEGARWILICLTHPEGRADLEALLEQSDLSRGKTPLFPSDNLIRNKQAGHEEPQDG